MWKLPGLHGDSSFESSESSGRQRIASSSCRYQERLKYHTGLVKAIVNDSLAVLLQINCRTEILDFLIKNKENCAGMRRCGQRVVRRSRWPCRPIQTYPGRPCCSSCRRRSACTLRQPDSLLCQVSPGPAPHYEIWESCQSTGKMQA